MLQTFQIISAFILALGITGNSNSEINLRQERIDAGVCEDEHLGSVEAREEEWDLCRKTYTTTARKKHAIVPSASGHKGYFKNSMRL